MKAIILAGGKGTRLTEETSIKPKPMVEIAGKPILWHIMKIYSMYGINEFIICCGYKGYMIKEYFANYSLHMSDITFDFDKNSTIIHESLIEPWKVTLVDTGLDTLTGGRLKRVKKYIGGETFCFTYGDGVSNVNINNLIKFHRSKKVLATLTAVQPLGRFGRLIINKNMVSNFEEKPIGDQGWINGGFFVLEPEVIDLIDNDLTIWEREPLETLSKKRQLAAYNHKGFWEAMDTLEIKAVDKLLSLMEISEDIQTSILTFNINSSEPRLAVEINQLFIDELDSHQRRYNKAKTNQTRQFIEERIIETEKELMSAEEDLKVFMDRNRRIENSPALQLEQQRFGREVTVLTGVFTTLKQQLETIKIEEVKESNYVIVIDPPEIPLQRSKPNKTRMVVLSGIMGIGIGLILAFLFENFRNSEKEEKDKMMEVKSLFSKNIFDFFSLK